MSDHIPNPVHGELYNLENDRTESNDLAQVHPELVNALAKEWQAWANDNMVVDWKVFENKEY